jgi:hypothetical protein
MRTSAAESAAVTVLVDWCSSATAPPAGVAGAGDLLFVLPEVAAGDDPGFAEPARAGAVAVAVGAAAACRCSRPALEVVAGCPALPSAVAVSAGPAVGVPAEAGATRWVKRAPARA